MNIAIVDDDKTAARLLADKLKGFEEAHISGIAANGMDGLALVMDTNPDLLFLDIELPDISGIEFLERIADSAASDCRVVMYTAHQKFMLSAFRNQAFDYLMKPIDDQELRTIIRRVCLDMQMPKPVSPMRVALSDNAANAVTMCADGIGRRTDGKFLIYTNAVDFRLVDVRDIGIVAYQHGSRVWEMYVSGLDKPIRLKRNVTSDMIVALDPSLVRVSQKHIINLTYLMEVTDNTCRLFPPFNNLTDVKVGRFYRKKLIEMFSGFKVCFVLGQSNGSTYNISM